MAIALGTSETAFMRTLRKGLLAKVRDRFGSSLDPSDETVYEGVVEYVEEFLSVKKKLSSQQKKHVQQGILDEVFGLGPLGPVLRHPHAANIYLEGPDRAFIEMWGPRGGHHIKKLKLPFEDEKHLLDVINRIIVPLGGALKSDSPFFSGVLPYGNRVYAAISPVSVHGSTLSIICREQSVLEVVPNWRLSCLHFDQGHEAKAQTEVLEGQEKNSIQIKLSEFRTDADLSQTFSARSLKGKTVSFIGNVEVWDDPIWAEDTVLASALSSCYKRGAEACIVAIGKGGKRLAISRSQVDLQNQGSQTFECLTNVPPDTVRLTLVVHLRGPIKATISDLDFSLVAPAKLRPVQGPRNLELRPAGVTI